MHVYCSGREGVEGTAGGGGRFTRIKGTSAITTRHSPLLFTLLKTEACGFHLHSSALFIHSQTFRFTY